MPCTIRHFEDDELQHRSPNAGTPRMERLQKLICGGSWNNKNKINLIYWHPDAAAPDGGHWVAWVDPDPLPGAGVTVTP